jgi:hypothetical protein
MRWITGKGTIVSHNNPQSKDRKKRTTTCCPQRVSIFVQPLPPPFQLRAAGFASARKAAVLFATRAQRHGAWR